MANFLSFQRRHPDWKETEVHAGEKNCDGLVLLHNMRQLYDEAASDPRVAVM